MQYLLLDCIKIYLSNTKVSLIDICIFMRYVYSSNKNLNKNPVKCNPGWQCQMSWCDAHWRARSPDLNPFEKFWEEFLHKNLGVRQPSIISKAMYLSTPNRMFGMPCRMIIIPLAGRRRKVSSVIVSDGGSTCNLM